MHGVSLPAYTGTCTDMPYVQVTLHSLQVCTIYVMCTRYILAVPVLHIYHSSGRCEISTAITEVKHHLHRLDDVVHQSLFAQLAAPPLLLSDALPGSQELLLRGSLDPVSPLASVLLG